MKIEYLIGPDKQPVGAQVTFPMSRKQAKDLGKALNGAAIQAKKKGIPELRTVIRDNQGNRLVFSILDEKVIEAAAKQAEKRAKKSASPIIQPKEKKLILPP